MPTLKPPLVFSRHLFQVIDRLHIEGKLLFFPFFSPN
jgi:hypothetical protein